MKRVFIGLILSMGLFTLFACNKDDQGNGTTPIDDGITRVILLINGNLGDKSFFDSAVEGILAINAFDGVDASYIEMGTDSSRWESTLRSVSTQNYDLIIVGTWQMSEQLQRVSKRFPDNKYVIFDSEVHEDRNDEYPNVHSIRFDQSQAAFLAGYVAAHMTQTGKIGFIGGQRIDTINDFAIGYVQGVEYSGLPITVATSYIGSFDNSALAKSLAEAQYNSGVDIIFQAASQAGLGVFDAAKVKNKYVIGVDTNQYDYFVDTDLEKARLIITSVLKKVDQVLIETVNAFLSDELEYGVLRRLGLAEGIVGLAKNEHFLSLANQTLVDAIENLEIGILNGSIEVKSAYDIPRSEVDEILDRNRP